MKFGDNDFVLNFLASPAVAVGTQINAGGVPTQKLRKEIIRVGEFAKGDKPISISLDLLNHWATTFHKMAEAGIKIPVPKDHSMKAEDSMGNVVDMFVEGDSLIGVLEMIGQDAITMALRNGVSLYSPADWQDGKGNTFARPVVHVALTPYPVIPGLGEWEAISASFIEKGQGMNWKQIRESIGADDKTFPDDMAEDKAAELILAAVSTEREKAKLLEKQLEEIKKQLAGLKLSKTTETKEPVNPMLLSLMGENRRMKINALASGEKPSITPAVAKELIGLYADGDGLMLSLSSSPDQFDKLLAVLEKNSALVGLRQEKTGAQVLQLSMTSDTADKSLVASADKAATSAKKVW